MSYDIALIELAKKGTLDGKLVTESEVFFRLFSQPRNLPPLSQKFHSHLVNFLYGRQGEGQERFISSFPFGDLTVDKAGNFITDNSRFLKRALLKKEQIEIFLAENNSEEHLLYIVNQYHEISPHSEDFIISSFMRCCLSWSKDVSSNNDKVIAYIKNSLGEKNPSHPSLVFIRKLLCFLDETVSP